MAELKPPAAAKALDDHHLMHPMTTRPLLPTALQQQLHRQLSTSLTESTTKIEFKAAAANYVLEASTNMHEFQ